jgi:hypothetical protein
MIDIIDESLAFSIGQYSGMADTMLKIPDVLPRSTDAGGRLLTAKSGWWTSGFFPGSLWYLYEYSNDEKLKDAAIRMTSRVEREKFNTGTHDLGFMLYCSFGNGFRLTGDTAYRGVLLTGANSLLTRFRPLVGCIQSWDHVKKWECPVIIDNMMNLEYLAWAFKETGDSAYYNTCISHSDTTIKYHFRPDFSSYHVVSYDTVTGRVEARQTAQGYSDESSWARGQSWGLYGYTVMYRETGLPRYLDQARKIAGYLIDHPRMPADKIPYWDYDAPGIPSELRDASAGATMASALIELSGMVDSATGQKYLETAEVQLRSLASPAYRSSLGENGNFILMHSVGSMPGKGEIDVPLTYADYYFIEALMRYRRLLLEDN